MSLIDDLRAAADKIPPSHIPSLNELAGVVGAFIAHAEHGDDLFTAAEQGAEAVAKLFAPAAEDVAGVLAADATQASAPASESQQVAELERQLQAQQTLIAQLQRGQATSTPAAGSPAGHLPSNE